MRDWAALPEAGLARYYIGINGATAKIVAAERQSTPIVRP